MYRSKTNTVCRGIQNRSVYSTLERYALIGKNHFTLYSSVTDITDDMIYLIICYQYTLWNIK